jgi:hypothetical protein
LAVVIVWGLVLWGLDEFRYRTSWYLGLSCYPPELTTEMLKGFVAAELKLDTRAGIEITELYREDHYDWPSYTARFRAAGHEYLAVANGCGIRESWPALGQD